MRSLAVLQQAVAITSHLKGVSRSALLALVYASAALAVDPTLTLISHARNVYLAPLIALASSIWHGAA